MRMVALFMICCGRLAWNADAGWTKPVNCPRGNKKAVIRANSVHCKTKKTHWMQKYDIHPMHKAYGRHEIWSSSNEKNNNKRLLVIQQATDKFMRPKSVGKLAKPNLNYRHKFLHKLRYKIYHRVCAIEYVGSHMASRSVDYCNIFTSSIPFCESPPPPPASICGLIGTSACMRSLGWGWGLRRDAGKWQTFGDWRGGGAYEEIIVEGEVYERISNVK